MNPPSVIFLFFPLPLDFFLVYLFLLFSSLFSLLSTLFFYVFLFPW